MKVIAYWEKVDEAADIPWHILLCLAALRIDFQDNFLLLTPKNIDQYIGSDYANKHWSFGTIEESDVTQKKVSIVAKSDYIRLKYIYEHGGFWFDSDALCVGDPKNIIKLLDSYDVVWGYEAFFGAKAGNQMFKDASDRMLDMPCQIWGNPGEIKAIVEGSKNASIGKIPNGYINPLSSALYSWRDTSILFSENFEPNEFLSKDQVFLHLYNKFTEKIVSDHSLSVDFKLEKLFQSQTLIAKIVRNKYSQNILSDAANSILFEFK